PVHASWLNQIEVYFSVVQRKLLTPNDVKNLAELKRNVMAFQARYQRAAKPFRVDLHTPRSSRPPHQAREAARSCRKIPKTQYVTVIANHGTKDMQPACWPVRPFQGATRIRVRPTDSR